MCTIFVRFCLLVGCCILSTVGQSQERSYVTDSLFVRNIDEKFTIGINFKHNHYKARFHAFDDELRVGAANYLIGGRFRYKNLHVVGSFPVFKTEQNGYTMPNFYSVGIKYYPKNFLFTWHGSYSSLINSWSMILRRPVDMIQDDSKICHMNIFGAYLFDRDQLNLNGFFNFSKQQKKTAGSWLVSAFYDLNYWDVKEEDVLIFQDETFDYTFLRRSRYSVGGGYIQCVVYNRFSFMAMINLGAEYVTIDHSRVRKGRDYNAFALNPTLKFLGFATYHFEDKYLGLTSDYFPDLVVRPDIYSRLQYWMVRLSAGVHF